MAILTFKTVSFGKTPRDAFIEARRRAIEVHGAENCQGTIAEKNSYQVIDLGRRRNIDKLIDKIIEKADPDGVAGVNGPAGCIELKNMRARRARRSYNMWYKNLRVFIFFGQMAI